MTESYLDHGDLVPDGVVMDMLRKPLRGASWDPQLAGCGSDSSVGRELGDIDLGQAKQLGHMR